jgi:hypothetical protein
LPLTVGSELEITKGIVTVMISCHNMISYRKNFLLQCVCL